MSDDLEYDPHDAVNAMRSRDNTWKVRHVDDTIDSPYITVVAPNGQRFIAIMEYDEQELT